MREKVDLLLEKKISAIWYCRGEFMEKNLAHVVYAIQNGFWIGNHSYTHPHFSDISLKEARGEIVKTEELIDKAYAIAERLRPARLFRFPYMDKGLKKGLEHVQHLQQLLHSLNFEPLIFKGVKHPALSERKEDIDASWTFDAREYALFSEKTMRKYNLFSIADFVQRVVEELFQFSVSEIVLFHDFEQTHHLFSPLLNTLIEQNVEFKTPVLEKTT